MAKAIAELRKLGLQPSPQDLPPVLGWEQELWEWYRRLPRQWRIGPMGPVGLDLSVWMPVIQQQGWDVATALDLLGEIEDGFLAPREVSETPSNDTRH